MNRGGGVLEHPAHSTLWAAAGLPAPLVRALRLALFFAVGLVLGGGSVAAFAAAADYGRSMRLNAPASSGARFTGAPIYDWADAPSGWGRMNDINKINIGSKSFDVTGGRLFSPRTLAKGAVSFARFGGPAWLGFMLAPLVWDEVQGWLKEQDIYEPPAGNVPFDRPGWWCSAGGRTYQGTAGAVAAACAAASGWDPTQYPVQSIEITSAPPSGFGEFSASAKCGGYTCAVIKTLWGACGNGEFYDPSIGACAPVGTTAATDQDLEDAIYRELVARGMGSDLARRLIKAGYKPTPDGFDLDGPSSIPGDTVTTTTSGPAGQTSTTTNTTHNMTYNTTNNTSTVTITNTTTTTVTSPDGTTTETTTETRPGGGETTPPEEPKPFCELYPTASACAELGETQDEELDKESVNVSWQKEGGAAGACPAPIQISVLRTQHAIQWTPICQVASGIRPIVIGLAWLSAALWLFLMARARA